MRSIISLLVMTLSVLNVSAQKNTSTVQESRYYSRATSAPATLDAEGFIRRWMVLEPVSKPNHTNIVFTDSYLREVFAKQYFKNQMTCMPKDGDKVKAVCETVDMPKDFRRVDPATLKHNFTTETLRWHKLDSKAYNLKLMRFGEEKKQRLYGVIYFVMTTISCDEDINDVRLSVGSNSASMWWIDGKEALILSGDRRMVADDGVSHRISLSKGTHVLRGCIINGPGMSDFCVRFLAENGTPVIENVKIK